MKRDTVSVFGWTGAMFLATFMSLGHVSAQIYVQYKQTQNMPFEQAGRNHRYVGQLIMPLSHIAITQINMEMAEYSGWPNFSPASAVSAEIWQTDLGNDWAQ